MFAFSEDEEMYAREVRAFARKELAPFAKARAKMSPPYPVDVRKKIGGFGLLGMELPEEYGGQGHAGFVKLGIAMEEIGAADVSAANPLTSLIAGHYIAQFGDKEMAQKWLPPLISGDETSCMAVTEPQSGSDAAGIKTRARKDGKYYVINGEKTSISWGTYASVAVLFATTDPPAGARGITAFMVPMDDPSIKKSAFPDMGFLSHGRASLFFDDTRIPERYRLGEEGKGFVYVMQQFDYVRSLLGLQVLGAARTSLEEAVEYAKQRKAFGQPISKYEGVAFKIAEHATRIEAARLLCYRALWLKEQGLPHSKEAAMCKWWCPRVAVDAIHDCLLIHGHYGYSTEYPVEQRLRDVIGLEIGDGTEEIQKLVIARHIFGKEYAP